MTDAVNRKVELYALTDDEIAQVTGGAKKTTKADTARKFEEFVRDNTVTESEYAKIG